MKISWQIACCRAGESNNSLLDCRHAGPLWLGGVWARTVSLESQYSPGVCVIPPTPPRQGTKKLDLAFDGCKQERSSPGRSPRGVGKLC